MDRSELAKDPDSYVGALRGWQRDLVASLRETVSGAGDFDERIKWGHLVYFANGPALLIRVQDNQVIFGFWRGQRMTDLEPRLKAGGKYEMARVDFAEHDVVEPGVVAELAGRAFELNQVFGDPTKDAPRSMKNQ